MGGSRTGPARVQELCEAIGAFRESGKLTAAWSESFASSPRGLPYYRATAFDRIYLQPSRALGLTGVGVEQVFLYDALAKSASPSRARSATRKSAAANLTERGFTGPNREANERLAVSIAEQIDGVIAARRGKTKEQVRALLDRGPSRPMMPWPRGWSTCSCYRDEVDAEGRKEAGRTRSCRTSAATRAHAPTQRARSC